MALVTKKKKKSGKEEVKRKFIKDMEKLVERKLEQKSRESAEKI